MNGRALRQLLFSLVIALGSSAGAHADGNKDQAGAPGAEMSDGEVRKIDRDGKKITIKHGEIKSLDMPPMTMVFRVGDPGMLDGLQVGDRVTFKASISAGAIVVNEIRQAR